MMLIERGILLTNRISCDLRQNIAHSFILTIEQNFKSSFHLPRVNENLETCTTVLFGQLKN